MENINIIDWVKSKQEKNLSLEWSNQLISMGHLCKGINLNLTKMEALWNLYVKKVIISHTIDPLVTGTQFDRMIGLVLILQKCAPQKQVR